MPVHVDEIYAYPVSSWMPDGQIRKGGISDTVSISPSRAWHGMNGVDSSSLQNLSIGNYPVSLGMLDQQRHEHPQPARLELLAGSSPEDDNQRNTHLATGCKTARRLDDYVHSFGSVDVMKLGVPVRGEVVRHSMISVQSYVRPPDQSRGRNWLLEFGRSLCAACIP